MLNVKNKKILICVILSYKKQIEQLSPSFSLTSPTHCAEAGTGSYDF